jgi:hypothetical protein
MIPDLELQNLKALFKSAFDKHGWKKKKRFYNLTTTENFIYHLSKIKDRAKRQLAYSNLNEYLVILNEIPEPGELDARSSDELFAKYLQPLITIYETRLGFVLFIPFPYLLFIFLFAELAAFGFKASLWIHLLIDFVFLSYAIYQLYKRKQKKIYGLFV